MCPLLYLIASGLRGKLPFWQTVGQALGQSVGQIPLFIWTARWVLLALGGVSDLVALAVVVWALGDLAAAPAAQSGRARTTDRRRQRPRPCRRLAGGAGAALPEQT
jgi:hypothetical protein